MSQDIDKIIKEGLQEIDKEVQQEDNLRQQAEHIANLFKVNPVVKVEIDGKIFELAMKESKALGIILLVAADVTKRKIAGINYKPAMYKLEYNDEFTYEENSQTLISSFLAHKTGNFKIEVLEDEGSVKVAREKDIINNGGSIQ